MAWGSGAAQWRSGDWQIAPGAGAAGQVATAPGVADAVPVFAYYQHTALIRDRSTRAGVLRFDREESRSRICANWRGTWAVWSAPGGAVPLFAALLSLPYATLPPCPCRRAAEAENHARFSDDPAAHRRAAARALCDGRPALGSIRHPRVAQSLVDQWPQRPVSWPCSPFAPTSPALDRARAPHPGTLSRLPRRQARR